MYSITLETRRNVVETESLYLRFYAIVDGSSYTVTIFQIIPLPAPSKKFFHNPLDHLAENGTEKCKLKGRECITIYISSLTIFRQKLKTHYLIFAVVRLVCFHSLTDFIVSCFYVPCPCNAFV